MIDQRYEKIWQCPHCQHIDDRKAFRVTNLKEVVRRASQMEPQNQCPCCMLDVSYADEPWKFDRPDGCLAVSEGETL
jgi:hypothetical protein